MFFFFQAEDGIRYLTVTGVQTCALPILLAGGARIGLLESLEYDPLLLRGYADAGITDGELDHRGSLPQDRMLGRLPRWSSSPSVRSEEHTPELQSQSNLVCRLLLGKKTLSTFRL